MVLSAGFEATYKFVKQVNETTGNGRTAALFLMTLGAHDEKVVSFVRSLFPTQLVDDARGLRVTRSGRTTESSASSKASAPRVWLGGAVLELLPAPRSLS